MLNLNGFVVLLTCNQFQTTTDQYVRQLCRQCDKHNEIRFRSCPAITIKEQDSHLETEHLVKQYAWSEDVTILQVDEPVQRQRTCHLQFWWLAATMPSFSLTDHRRRLLWHESKLQGKVGVGYYNDKIWSSAVGYRGNTHAAYCNRQNISRIKNFSNGYSKEQFDEKLLPPTTLMPALPFSNVSRLTCPLQPLPLPHDWVRSQ